MGYNELVNRERIATAIDKELSQKIRELSKSTRIPLSRLLDEAIADLLKKFEPKGQD